MLSVEGLDPYYLHILVSLGRGWQDSTATGSPIGRRTGRGAAVLFGPTEPQAVPGRVTTGPEVLAAKKTTGGRGWLERPRTAPAPLSLARGPQVWLSHVNSIISTASRHLFLTAQRPRRSRGARDTTTSASTPPGSCRTFPDNGFP